MSQTDDLFSVDLCSFKNEIYLKKRVIMGKAGYIFPIEDAKHPDTMDSSFGRPSASFNIFNNDVTLIHSDMI